MEKTWMSSALSSLDSDEIFPTKELLTEINYWATHLNSLSVSALMKPSRRTRNIFIISMLNTGVQRKSKAGHFHVLTFQSCKSYRKQCIFHESKAARSAPASPSPIDLKSPRIYLSHGECNTLRAPSTRLRTLTETCDSFRKLGDFQYHAGFSAPTLFLKSLELWFYSRVNDKQSWFDDMKALILSVWVTFRRHTQIHTSVSIHFFTSINDFKSTYP